MTERRLREGARWGNDPEPLPAPVSGLDGPSAEYSRLCVIYGEENVQKAISIYNGIKHKYPHVTAASWEPLKFAAVALECAQSDMKKAALDGRPHSLPETLDVHEQSLGPFLVINPHCTRWTSLYGDEKAGLKANAARARIVTWSIGIAIGSALTFYITKNLLVTFTMAFLFGVAMAIDERYGWKSFINQNWQAIGILLVLVVVSFKVSSNFIGIFFTDVSKQPRSANFTIKNHTVWSDTIVIWASLADGRLFCPIVKNVSAFTSAAIKYECNDLTTADYALHATWASKRPEIASWGRRLP